MTERTEGILNALTIVGLVLVSFVSVVSVALGVMLLTGYFDKHYDPLGGLRFNTAEALVISDTGNSVYLTVTSDKAYINADGEVLQDNTVDTDIRIKVYNGNGDNKVEDYSIIDVPSVVKKGEPFKITAKVLEDGFNKGGVCYIAAETADTLYRTPTLLPVYVDVPIEAITLSAVDNYTGAPVDLENTKFVFEDAIQINVNVFPTRAQYVYGNTAEIKDVLYISSRPQSADMDRDTGLMDIVYNHPCEEQEQVESPIDDDGYVTITARANKYSTNTQEFQVSATADIKIFPLQLGEIVIKNDSFKLNESVFSTQLFQENKTLKISAEDTGLSDVTNLNIFLQPTIFREDHNKETSPLTGLAELVVDYEILDPNAPVVPEPEPEPASLDLGGEPEPYFCEPIEIIKQVAPNGVAYWEITAKRLIESDERVFVTMNILNYNDSFEIKREVKIHEVRANISTFSYLNEDGNEFSNVLKLSATKYDEHPEDNQYEKKSVFYTFRADEGTPSFSKVVAFVNKVNSNSTDPINQNIVGSQIVVADETYYQLTQEVVKKDSQQNVLYNGFEIESRGAGNVAVVAYLVRSNEFGQPVDINYNVITTDPNLAGQPVDPQFPNEAKYVLAAGVCSINDIANANEGQYIAHQNFGQNARGVLDVVISEKLKELKLYKDATDAANLIPETVPGTQDPYIVKMGTNYANGIIIYAKPNSVLAIPSSADEYQNAIDRYDDIEVREVIPGTGSAISDAIFKNLDSSLMSKHKYYFNNLADEGSEGYQYQRYMSFELVASAKTTENMPRRLELSYGDNANSLYIESVEVKVDKVTVSAPSGQLVAGANLLTWNLYPEISPGSVKFKSGTEVTEYYRLSYIDNICGNLGYPLLPGSVSDISQEDKDAGLKAPSSQEVSRKIFLFNEGSFTIDYVDENGGEHFGNSGAYFGSLEYMIAEALNPMTDKNLVAAIWNKIEALISENELLGLSADDYVEMVNFEGVSTGVATTGDHNLFIKKVLPNNSRLLLFYIPIDSDGKEYAFTDVSPDIVKISYSWPILSSTIYDWQIPNNAIETTGGNVYFIFDEEGQDERAFDYSSVVTVTAMLNMPFGPQPQNLNATYRISYKINNPSVLAHRVEPVDDMTSKLVFKLINPATDDQTYDVTIKRTVHFVTDYTLPYISPIESMITWDKMATHCLAVGAINDPDTDKNATDTDKAFAPVIKTMTKTEDSIDGTIVFKYKYVEPLTPEGGEGGEGGEEPVE